MHYTLVFILSRSVEPGTDSTFPRCQGSPRSVGWTFSTSLFMWDVHSDQWTPDTQKPISFLKILLIMEICNPAFNFRTLWAPVCQQVSRRNERCDLHPTHSLLWRKGRGLCFNPTSSFVVIISQAPPLSPVHLIAPRWTPRLNMHELDKLHWGEKRWTRSLRNVRQCHNVPASHSWICAPFLWGALIIK